jgi:glutamate N-acetyltransferase / amino-acid N-acetyltransferase
MDDFTCPGFRAAGIAVGIKKADTLDLALIVNDTPVGAAALFTENRVKAAPVVLSMERIKKTLPRAVLVNSGCANACTGPEGRKDADILTGLVAKELSLSPGEILAASTGVIGQRLPRRRIEDALPRLVADLSPRGFGRVARAIMTTDTLPKCIMRRFSAQGREFTILGMAKGAGMICPNLATMLSFVVTDFPLSGGSLENEVRRAADASFNAITIDGDMSTNDTVMVMTGGDASFRPKSDDIVRFSDMLSDLMGDLARQLVRDGEGATKFVTITVSNAPDTKAARATAFRIANSPLVKTAVFGQDPNWGRIMGAVGCVADGFNPLLADIYFNDIPVVRGGVGCGDEKEAQAAKVMRQREYAVIVDLHSGTASFTAYTCDLSVDYVKINADYRS